MQDINERFIFVLPKAITNKIEIVTSSPNKTEDLMRERANAMIKEPIEKALSPFYEAAIRQRIFFPDRKMVQFDSGKLQALSILLQKLKKGGHKCLIFTQMSKMLDENR
jgi:E1A-binding protein p400